MTFISFIFIYQRSDSPQEDECVQCPPGSYNMERTFWHPNRTQSGTSPPPVGFCHQCPKGAECTGGNSVESLEGYQTLPRTQVQRRGPQEPSLNSTIVEAYLCPSGACAGNNKCNGGRQGVLCAFCAKGEYLDGKKCEKNDFKVVILWFGVVIMAFMFWIKIVFFGWSWGCLGNLVQMLSDHVRSGIRAKRFERVTKILTKIDQLITKMPIKRFLGKISSKVLGSVQGTSKALGGVQGTKILLGNFQVRIIPIQCSAELDSRNIE